MRPLSTENKHGRDLHSGETCDVVPGKKEQEADRSEEPRHTETGGFELDVGPDDAAEQKERGKHGDVEGRFLETARLDLDDRTFQPRFAHKVGHRSRDALGEERLAADFFRGLLRAHGQQLAFLVDHFVADFDFLFLVDEGFGDFRVVTVAFRRAAKISRVV